MQQEIGLYATIIVGGVVLIFIFYKLFKKIMMYAKWFIMGIVYLLLTIIGLVFVPFIYPIRKWIRRKEIVPFWWFVNNTLPEVKGDIDWGDFGRFKHNFKGFYQQNALRNPFHNLKIEHLSPNKKGFRKIINWEFWTIKIHIKIGYGKTKYLYTFKFN